MLSRQDKDILERKPLNTQAISDLAELRNTDGITDVALLVGLAYSYGEMQGIRKERARAK